MAGLAQRILDRRAADTGEGGERVNRQAAGAAAPLDLAGDNAEDCELAEREGRRRRSSPGTAPLMACRRRRSRLACLSGELGLLACLGRRRAGLACDRAGGALLVAKALLRVWRASLTASASASRRWPSAWARQSRRAVSSKAVLLRAPEAAAMN